MNFFKRLLIISLVMSLTTSCSDPNILEDFSQTESDEAYFIEAQKKVDNLEFTLALDILENKISAGYQQRVKVKELRAGAYAGRCGFTFADIFAGIQNSSTTNIFPYFMSIFGYTTVIPAACDNAITIMESLGSVLTRTNDQNLFLSILGLARVGTTLKSKLDGTIQDGVAEGAYLTGYNVCHNYVAGVADDGWANVPPLPAPETMPVSGRTITDADVKKIASGVGLIFENISALGGAMSGGNSVVTALESALTQCESLPGGPDCQVTDPNLVSDELVYAIRVLLADSSMGFGTCTAGAVPNPPTPPFPPTFCCPGLQVPGSGL